MILENIIKEIVTNFVLLKVSIFDPKAVDYEYSLKLIIISNILKDEKSIWSSV